MRDVAGSSRAAERGLLPSTHVHRTMKYLFGELQKHASLSRMNPQRYLRFVRAVALLTPIVSGVCIAHADPPTATARAPRCPRSEPRRLTACNPAVNNQTCWYDSLRTCRCGVGGASATPRWLCRSVPMRGPLNPPELEATTVV